MNITNKKVKEGITSLIHSNPFFASILLQQEFREDNSEPTFSVDGEVFRYNSEFAAKLSFDELKGVCAHEALHLALLHHARMNGRDLETWNRATDYAINGELIEQGFKLPKGALVDSRFADMSAEDIYRKLDQEKKQNQQGNTPQNQPGQSQSQGAPQSGQGTPSFGQIKPAKDPAAAEAKGKAVLEKAMSIARMAGEMPGDLERELKENAKPLFDWREILHRFFQDVCSRDYSFQQPNKRFAHLGVILPTLRSRSIGKVLLAVDTSGSISTEEVSAMVAEMQECLVAYTDEGVSAELTVIYCDARVQRVETLLDGDTPHPVGGGGTDFRPVFSHVAGDIGEAACLVYLTDGECDSYPDAAPSYPVLWGLIRDNEAFAPPFGETVKVAVI